MLHHLEGRLVELADDHVVLDVGGVGYRVYTSRQTREELFTARRRDGAQSVKLFVSLHLREGDLALYGFSTPEERELFELLLTVAGIGPKVAISILSATTPRRLQEAIVKGSAAELAAIKGIGKRTAQRLIVELKEKVARLPLGAPAAAPLDEREETALRALTRTLGFRESEARRALERVREEYDELSTEELIKRALERLSKP